MSLSKFLCIVCDVVDVGFSLGIHVRAEGLSTKIVRSGPLLTIFSVQFIWQTGGRFRIPMTRSELNRLDPLTQHRQNPSRCT